MNLEVLKIINKIIERDSKDTTYKYALLRGIIDIIQEFPHFKKEENESVTFPVGLLVHKWLLYYYPIFASRIFLPQKNGETEELIPGKIIAFRNYFNPIFNYYENESNGGFNVFYNDIKTNNIPSFLKPDLVSLLNKIFQTIVNMPMKHLGFGIYKKYYSITHFNNDRKYKISNNFKFLDIIYSFGTFNIHKEFFDIFDYLGRFISGSESILFKWAEFTVKVSEKSIKNYANIPNKILEYPELLQDKKESVKFNNISSLSNTIVLNEILKNPESDRDIKIASHIFDKLKNQQNGKLICIWTGDKIKQYDIDHLIPFSIWKNNNLWNLFPTKHNINLNKSDKIPSIRILEKQKDLIIYYWNEISKYNDKIFFRELEYSLIGNSFSINNWEMIAFNALKQKCEHLVFKRGYSEWN